MPNPQIRPIVICLFRKGDSILVSEGYDRVKRETFYRPLGGGIEFGEPSEDALRREIKEEIDAELTDAKLLGVLDNLFVFEGVPGHQIVLVYDAALADPALYQRGSIAGLHGLENGVPFKAIWKHLDDFADGNPPLYPNGLREMLVQAPMPSPEVNDPATIVVRECRADDLPIVHQLQMAWAAERITYGYEAPTLQALAARLGPFFLVAIHEQSIVGFACGSIRTSDGLAVVPSGQRYLDLDDLFVTQSLRGRGIGGKLLETLQSRARAASIPRCLVYSSTKNVRQMLHFYEAHGFQSWFVQMVKEL